MKGGTGVSEGVEALSHRTLRPRSCLLHEAEPQLDYPAMLGVLESGQVHRLIGTLRDRGLPIILISHNMPVLWELANRVQIMRLGQRIAIVSPETTSMEDAVALMTGAKAAPAA